MKIRNIALCLAATMLMPCLNAVEMRIIHSGVVNDKIVDAQCPTGVAKLENGEIVSVFVDHGDVVAGSTNYFVTTKNNGKRWSRPFMKIAPTQDEVGVAIAFNQLKDGRIFGTRSDVSHTDTSTEGFKSYRVSKSYVVSFDFAEKTHTRIAELEAPFASIQGVMGMNFTKLSNGDILLPCYIYAPAEPEEGFPFGSGFYRSTDDGKTWGKFELAFQEPDPSNPFSFNESVIFEKEDHTLVAFARIDSRPVNNMWKVTSTDFGKTWSMPEETLIPAVCPSGFRTQDGYYIMLAGYLKADIPRTVTIFYSEDGENFIPLGRPYYSRPKDKQGRPNNTGTGGSQAIIEVSRNKFLVVFYGTDPKLTGRDQCYVDSCYFEIKR